MPKYLNVIGKDFVEGVTVDAHGTLLTVNSQRFPALAGVTPGMIVRSVNGAPFTSPADEKRRYEAYAGEILVVVGPAVNQRGSDEFDLDSDEDNASFNPATALAPLPAESANAVAQDSAQVIADAARKCSAGACIIIMSEGANPALPISLAAEQAKIDVMFIDTVGRMKTRQSIDDAGETFKKSLEKGLWIYVEQATKSITLLRKLAECITEVNARKKINARTRVFLMCEPHPHFPEALMKNSITLRCRLQGSSIADVNVTETVMESQRRRNVLQGDEDAAVVNASTPQISRPERGKKKVKISSEVNIVHLEKSTFLEMSASAHPPVERENAQGESISRVAKYSFGSNEKFISLCAVRDHRFAVGTNSGYVVLLDGDGLPLIHFRPHKACVWDVSFSTQFDFATACEDGTSTIFNYSLAGQDLCATSVASFQSDVFAVTYVDPADVSSPVLSGGLSATICILHSDRQNSSFIASGTSIQAMHATQNKHAVVGGGNGTCTLIDPARGAVLDTTNRHSRKVPAVSCCGTLAATGGFDRMLRLWDTRAGAFQLVSERPTNEVITAVAVSDKLLSACSGSDLIVWDVRNLTAPLATREGAWKDLTRGLVIDGDRIVTASVDGIARYWKVH